ncbi:hypothetical protein DdX_09772 [Ditylenchus destructor]|uniref:Uncharacterized protein n=1 Tax=Ditylenchus destructor TaxID=166010 RepID=A0AAD4N3A1_9BILA|nr:hypothetical protein DdX_09772 [Ditylenchus destructor]
MRGIFTGRVPDTRLSDGQVTVQNMLDVVVTRSVVRKTFLQTSLDTTANSNTIKPENVASTWKHSFFDTKIVVRVGSIQNLPVYMKKASPMHKKEAQIIFHYTSALNMARALRRRTIAYSHANALSKRKVAQLAVLSVVDWLLDHRDAIDEVYFVVPSNNVKKLYEKHLRRRCLNIAFMQHINKNHLRQFVVQ